MIRLGTGWAAFHLDRRGSTFETDQARRLSTADGASWSKESPVSSPTRTPHASVPTFPTSMVAAPGVRVFEIVPYKVTG